eukprot:6914251-Lingulodinium_polyedra.AAC.1
MYARMPKSSVFYYASRYVEKGAAVDAAESVCASAAAGRLAATVVPKSVAPGVTVAICPRIVRDCFL